MADPASQQKMAEHDLAVVREEQKDNKVTKPTRNEALTVYKEYLQMITQLEIKMKETIGVSPKHVEEIKMIENAVI